MSKLELVEASLPDSDFSFYITKLPEDHAEDKLALASPDSGVICRMEYQNFLFMELVLNLERLFHYMAESSGGDPEYQMRIRDQIELEIYKVNPCLSPDKVVLTKGGVLKLAPKAEGTILEKVSGWGRQILDINPYIVIEEIEILEDPTEMDLPPISGDYSFMGRFDTVECKWDRLNVDLKIRKFAKDGIAFIFGSEVSFSQDLHYKIHVIQRCLESADAVFALCDAVGLTEEARIPILADELYELCIKVNPFLRLGDVDLDAMRGKPNRKKTSTRGKAKNKSKNKVGSGKVFSEITKAELLTLADRMKAKVVGQHEAVDKIVDTIQIASCGLRHPEKPIATYLMCGTTGTGKTYVSKVLAEELCGSHNNIVRIDCSEYTQQHDVQKLIGAPPSYVGYEDGGYLTNAIQDNPFSVVLFDEIEKAHSKLFDLLLQIMDDARLTDGKGNVTDFRNCIILMTSNIGVSEGESVKSTTGFGEGGLLTEDKREEVLKSALKNRFRPEFLNRIDETLRFRSLTKDDALHVIDLLLDKVKGYLLAKEITVDFTDSVKTMVFEKGFSKKYGARPLERTIDKEIIKGMAKMLLRDEIKNGTRVLADYIEGGLVVTEVKPKVARKKINTVVKA